jgi:hypothetical protein
MEYELNITGFFKSRQELLDVVTERKICYDSEPYYIPDKKGSLLQIGFQINLYGTSPGTAEDMTPDSPEYDTVEQDMKRVAEALSLTCSPLHMCESTTIEPSTITYSPDRKMRPDVTVRIPIFDQNNFGHPVDEAIKNTLQTAIKLLESAGIRKTKWGG